MRLSCPWCGARDLTEFSYGGESHVARPVPFESVSDEAWSRYLFYRKNHRGLQAERWHHLFGCEGWFNVVRDTVTHEILSVYTMTDSQPAARQ